MKKLCFSSYFKVLSQSKIKISDSDLFRLVVGPFFKNDYEYNADSGDVAKYKKGKDFPSSIQVAATKIDHNALADIYSIGLEKNINPTYKENVVLAIKDLLISDISLSDTTVIGDNVYFTKQMITTKNTFSLPHLLANTTIYCLKIKNEETSSINNDYLKSLNPKKNTIFFEDTFPRVDTELSFTAKNDLFDKTFTEVKHTGSVITPNDSTIKLFTLRLKDREFSFQDINSFINKNIGRYIFSRAKRHEYSIKDDVESLGLDAVSALKRANPALSLGNHFSEIMLYSFLECSLQAPKIMSKFELDSVSKKFKSSSAGIHLLPSGDSSLKNHQLAFGASHILNDLNSAIDNAFLQVIDIKNNMDNEISIVEGSIFNNTFDPLTSDFLKESLIPNKSSTPRPDTSFGVFLGYSISLFGTESLNNTLLAAEITKRMRDDILGCIPYIQNKISKLSLTGHSFYFYVLPLIDAENDKDNIMDSAIGVII